MEFVLILITLFAVSVGLYILFLFGLSLFEQPKKNTVYVKAENKFQYPEFKDYVWVNNTTGRLQVITGLNRQFNRKYWTYIGEL